MHKIVIASKNDGKIQEIKEILNFKNVRILTYKDFKDWPLIKEKGQTFAENAYLKAKVVLEKFNLPVLADDSGLEVEILQGEPGIRSSRYAGEKAKDENNNQKLLKKLSQYSRKDRQARFRCGVVYLDPSGRKLFTEGVCEGYIAEEERGSQGFGYDPLFIPKGYEKSLAELPRSVKNSISHRGNALRRMKKLLREIGVK